LARWPKTLAREERRGVERKEDTLTGAQVLIWTAWRGSARAAGQRLPKEVFTSTPPTKHTHLDHRKHAQHA
jgi:hypothetical protein